MQAFYVKKREKTVKRLSQIKTRKSIIYLQKMKESEVKSFLNMILNLFFQGIPDRTVKNNQSKACPLSG